MSFTMLLFAGGCGDDGSTGAEETVRKAAENLVESGNTFHTDHEISIVLDGDPEQVDPEFAAIAPIELNITAKSDMEMGDEEAMPDIHMYEVEVTGLADLLRDLAKASGDSEVEGAMIAGMVDQFLSDAEIISMDEVFYFKLAGTWFRLSLDEMMSGIPDTANAEKASCFMDYYMGDLDTFTDFEDAGKEKIDGVGTRHFTARPDPGKTQQLLDENMQNTMDAMKQCGLASEDELDETAAQMGNMAELSAKAMEDTNVDIWVDADGNLRQWRVDYRMDIAELIAAASQDTDIADIEELRSVTMKMVMTTRFSAFGEDVDIQAPEGALPFEDLMDLFGGGSGAGGITAPPLSA